MLLRVRMVVLVPMRMLFVLFWVLDVLAGLFVLVLALLLGFLLVMSMFGHFEPSGMMLDVQVVALSWLTA